MASDWRFVEQRFIRLLTISDLTQSRLGLRLGHGRPMYELSGTSLTFKHVCSMFVTGLLAVFQT